MAFTSQTSGTLALGVLCAASLACCSCSRGGKALHPVSGKVFVEGKPAAKALVVFHPLNDQGPEVVRPRAVVRRDGSFQVYTYVAGDGAPAGDYVVTVRGSKLPPPVGPPTTRRKKKKDVPGPEVPVRYEDPATSKLHAHVKEGPNELPPFNLDGR
jgi:hypothetical protein